MNSNDLRTQLNSTRSHFVVNCWNGRRYLVNHFGIVRYCAIALRALNDNTTLKCLTTEARNPVSKDTLTNIVRICNCLFLVTWIGGSAGGHCTVVSSYNESRFGRCKLSLFVPYDLQDKSWTHSQLVFLFCLYHWPCALWKLANICDFEYTRWRLTFNPIDSGRPGLDFVSQS